tara:strand:+ start:376 stop:1011 length:636 start_codon:yes stop_codon:yes gene_type:complete
MNNSQRVTGIILAGGKSSRLGRDKAWEDVGGQRIIDRVIGALQSSCDEVLIIGDRPERQNELSLPKCIQYRSDELKGRGSIGGLYTGLKSSDTLWSLVVACDMPFISRELIRFMLSMISKNRCDAIVPIINGRYQPTHALYNSTCIPFIEKNISSGNFRMDSYFDEIYLEEISEDVINSIKGAELSFFNVNTEDDLFTAREQYKLFDARNG